MLEVRGLSAGYGAAPAVREASLEVAEGELVVAVGPNGAGKTTLINALAGLHRPISGQILFRGRDIAPLPVHRYCEEGIALVPEGRRLFTGMSVRENLELGAYRAGAKAERASTLAKVLDRFPVLAQRLEQQAGTLSGGQQQMLAIGRALMAQPRLLLLDEPSLGLAPAIVLEMFRIIREVNREGVAVLLVEQNVAMALELANKAYVLEEGHVELSSREKIRQAYLGH